MQVLSQRWSFKNLQRCFGPYERIKAWESLHSLRFYRDWFCHSHHCLIRRRPYSIVACSLGPHKREGNDDSWQASCLLGSKGTSKLVFYDHCVFRKQKKVFFLQAHTVLKVPQTVFILICGVLLEYILLGKKRYILTFVDDFSRKVWGFIP